MLPSLSKKTNRDLVLSLPNMPIQYKRKRQIFYVHGSLQHCPKRFSLKKGGEWSLVIRQKDQVLFVMGPSDNPYVT